MGAKCLLMQMGGSVGMPFLGRLPLEPSLAAGHGRPFVAFAVVIATLPSMALLHACQYSRLKTVVRLFLRRWRPTWEFPSWAACRWTRR